MLKNGLSDGETPDEPETVRIDPDCAEKLEHARGRILNLIKEKRPRFVPAFELMTFRDNTISVSVHLPRRREIPYHVRAGKDMAKEMVRLIECQRAFTYALRMVTTSDEIEGTINTLRG